MMKIVLAAGYNGFVGIEYEGANSEMQGFRRPRIARQVRDELS